MSRRRIVFCLLVAMTAWVGASRGVAAPADGKGAAFKIQIGGQWPAQSTGFASAMAPEVSEDDGGVVGALTFLRKDRSRYPYGVCLELDGNGVEVGPPVGAAGTQFFGIATVRITGLMEFRFRDPRAVEGERLQPYASLGAGWNFHSTGAKISWLVLPPPAGTPLALDLDGSPAVRLGVGFNHLTRGVSFNLEGGWKWDAGDYRLRLQGQAERRGRYDLSGMFLIFGVTLRG